MRPDLDRHHVDEGLGPHRAGLEEAGRGDPPGPAGHLLVVVRRSAGSPAQLVGPHHDHIGRQADPGPVRSDDGQAFTGACPHAQGDLGGGSEVALGQQLGQTGVGHPAALHANQIVAGPAPKGGPAVAYGHPDRGAKPLVR